MRILALQGVEGPGHFADSKIMDSKIVASAIIDPKRQCALTLCQFKLVAKLRIAIGLAHCQHVGVHNQLTALRAQKPEGKAGQFCSVEGAQPDTSRLPDSDGQGHRRGVKVGKSPDFPFDLFCLLQVFETMQVANCDRRFGFDLHHARAVGRVEQYTREGVRTPARAI